MKKLSGFRQLSLNCDSPQTPPRRPPLKKQFSEEINDYKTWTEHDISIKISLNNRNLRNPFIKNAWIENAHETFKDEPVIIKKCSENRRIPPNSLAKQNSTENEILKSRQDLVEKLKQTPDGKPNIRIFLAQHSKEQIEEENAVKEEKLNETPKLIQSLTTGIVSNDKNSFKLRKNAKQKTILNNEKDNAWQVPNKTKTFNEQDNENIFSNDKFCINDVKPIDSVIIRPATAASKREMFQKRTNSAFNATINVKETSKPIRKPLIRSSSAPCKPEHSKTKISSKNSKHKPFKKVQLKTAKNDESDKLNEDIPKSQKELNRTAAVQGNDVVTMVSLISPSGSDAEEDDDEEDTEDEKMKNKNNEKCKAEQKAPPKIMSLRKAVKTVSFQQSSIHAIRSFSSSFPARRASVTAAMMLNNNLNKIQEKRGTYSSTPDDDERVPKRRLVRCNTSFEKETLDEPEPSDSQKLSNFTVDLKSKEQNEVNEKPSTMVGDVEKPNETEEIRDNEAKKETEPNPDLKSPKEKQCWSMYCKMAEKGINISFDTILRGMLTPTEYRISKKHLLANVTTESSENPK